MKSISPMLKNILITAGILCLAFFLCFFLEFLSKSETAVSAIFVFSVFLTAFLTDGYIYSMSAAFLSMFVVNFASTFAYFKFEFSVPENFFFVLIALTIAWLTSSLVLENKCQRLMYMESEKERIRANLLRALSHDLRTPLTTIYGSSSALLENPSSFTEGQKLQMLQGIKEDAEWLVQMVENLLSITRIGNRNVKIVKSPVAIDELMDSVLQKFKKKYPQQEIPLEIPEEVAILSINPLLIEQVLVNILENAMEHAQGMTKLSIRISLHSPWAIFEITDDGQGIDKGRLEEILRGPYHPDARCSDGKRSNSGIGLSVCFTIIKLHGGVLQVENTRKGGALFRFSLPMEDSANEQQI